MTDTAWREASIAEISQAFERGQLTSEALTRIYLERIALYNDQGAKLNAIAALNPDAIEIAQRLDAERRRGQVRSPLHGIPLLVKDNYETLDMPTTAGSKAFAGFNPGRDAEMVANLRRAGAVILAKTTMHEFAYGITTVGSAFGTARNPYDPTRNPGGSSGGTGAGVAADFAVAGLGSDTCGSIRIPASHNALVGLRVSQGRLSAEGIVPLSSTQDVGGPLTKSVGDMALMMDVLLDGENFSASLAAPENARIGVLKDWWMLDPKDAEVAHALEASLGQLRDAGWTLVSLPSPAVNEALDRPVDGFLVLIEDFYNDLNRYLAANPELKIRNLEDLVSKGLHHPNIDGSLKTSLNRPWAREQYAIELKQRAILKDALTNLMAEHDLDALAYPTIRQIAAPLGQSQAGTNCRLSANSGLPAITIPAAFVDGLPVGLELLGRYNDEQTLLNLSLVVESMLKVRRPPNL